MTYVNAQGWATIIFIVAAFATLLLGVIFSHQLNRYGSGKSAIGVAEFVFTAVSVVILGLSAYALFFFNF